LSELLEVVYVSYDAASKENTTFYYLTRHATVGCKHTQKIMATHCSVTGSSNLVRSNDHGLAVKEYASQ